MNTLRKVIFSMFAVILMLPVFAATPANAQLDVWGGGEAGVSETDLQGATGLGNTDPRTVVAGVINAVLGFLGIIAVIIILMGGFKWMTAAGSEDKVSEAKKLITSGIIGLVIIFAAFGIASFIIDSVLGATGVSTN